MISCVLLAAGLSSRFGFPKAIAKLKEDTVIEHLQKQLFNTAIGEIIIVLGFDAHQIHPYLLKHKKAKVVYNKDYNLGQTLSFKIGLQNISKRAEGVMLFPVDYPAVQKKTLQQLLHIFREQNPQVLIPTFEGKKGHPPIFSTELKAEFLDLDHSKGVNTIAHQHLADTTFLPVDDPGVIQSFNTPEEFEVIKTAIN